MSSDRTARFTAWIAPGLLFGVALLLYLPRLGTPPRYVHDEVYHAYTAGQYLAGNTEAYHGKVSPRRQGVGYTWNHPPAGVLLIAGGIALWGDNPFGWRFSSALLGAAGIVVAYLLALTLTRDPGTAMLAASLLLVDGLYFVHSRIGMLDIFGTVFLTGAFVCLYRYLTAPPDRVRGPLLGTGALLGLALATKWNALYPLGLIGLVALWRTYRLWRRAAASPEGRSDAARVGLRAHLVWVPVALVAVPLAVYVAAYIPFFLQGHDLLDFADLQRRMYRYHSALKATHPYHSSWWQWPLALRPVWYYVEYGVGRTANIYAQANPVLYWAFLPAVLWLAIRWWRARDPALTVLLIGFFGQWLPWAAVPRVAFMYYFLPAVPFGALAVAAAAGELWQGNLPRRVLAAGYVAAVALAFVFFYPIYAGVPLARPALELRIWLEGWR